MIIDEIKKANIQAMRDRNMNARAIFSILIDKHLMATVDSRTSGKEVGDVEMVKIIQKTIKELEEEADNYAKVGNAQEVEKINEQKNILTKYLPSMLDEEEIKKIILTLEDKTVPSVMRYFRTNYNGKCEMKTVADVLKSIN